MAFKVSGDAQAVFFTKVFGASHAVVSHVKALIAAGVTFEVSLYSVQATYKGKVSSVSLTAGTTALMKESVNELVTSQNKVLIDNWVAEILQDVKPAPVPVAGYAVVTVLGAKMDQHVPNIIVLIKAIRAVTGLGLAGAKTLAETILAGHDVPLSVKDKATAITELQAAGVQVEDPKLTAVVPTFHGPTGPKPVEAVIPLKDAKALGQKVHGTSQGSVYYTIALTDHVRVAARLYKSGGGSVSIRTEWTDNPKADLKKLQEAGVLMKTGYGSIHFDAAGVPLERVVGAFLIGTGIHWKALVTSGADLVIGEKP